MGRILDVLQVPISAESPANIGCYQGVSGDLIKHLECMSQEFELAGGAIFLRRGASIARKIGLLLLLLLGSTTKNPPEAQKKKKKKKKKN